VSGLDRPQVDGCGGISSFISSTYNRGTIGDRAQPAKGRD
jgi:hypothetical protein